MNKSETPINSIESVGELSQSLYLLIHIDGYLTGP